MPSKRNRVKIYEDIFCFFYFWDRQFAIVLQNCEFLMRNQEKRDEVEMEK